MDMTSLQAAYTQKWRMATKEYMGHSVAYHSLKQSEDPDLCALAEHSLKMEKSSKEADRIFYLQKQAESVPDEFWHDSTLDLRRCERYRLRRTSDN